MRNILLLLALFVFAINAFNLTEYHSGVDLQLGFNSTQEQDGLDCLNALAGDVQQISQLIHSGNFDSIAEDLGSLVVQIQKDVTTTCAPYINDEILYMMQYTNISDLKQTVEENLVKYYPQVIDKVAYWAYEIQTGQDFEAGITQSEIFQILIGSLPYTGSSSVPQVNTSDITPFNASKFFSDYFTEIFNFFGIQAKPNVTALLQCYYPLMNFTKTLIYTKEKFSSFEFEQKLDVIEYLLNIGFYTIKSCEGAAKVEEILLGPIMEAFESDPMNFTINTLIKIGQSFPDIISSIQDETIDLEEGQYTQAGFEEAIRMYDVFGELVNFTSTS